jgi:hypothetical protein
MSAERGRVIGRTGLAEASEAADRRAAVKDGGQILGAFIGARIEEDSVVSVRGNWIRGRGFRIIRT